MQPGLISPSLALNRPITFAGKKAPREQQRIDQEYAAKTYGPLIAENFAARCLGLVNPFASRILVYLSLGQLAEARKNYAAAEKHYGRVVDIIDGRRFKNTEVMHSALQGLAKALEAQGRQLEAEQASDRALCYVHYLDKVQ